MVNEIICMHERNFKATNDNIYFVYLALYKFTNCIVLYLSKDEVWKVEDYRLLLGINNEMLK